MAAWQHGNDSWDRGAVDGTDGRLRLTWQAVPPGDWNASTAEEHLPMCSGDRASVARNARLIPSSDVALVKLLKILMPVLKLVPQRVQQDMASRAKY